MALQPSSIGAEVPLFAGVAQQGAQARAVPVLAAGLEEGDKFISLITPRPTLVYMTDHHREESKRCDRVKWFYRPRVGRPGARSDPHGSCSAW